MTRPMRRQRLKRCKKLGLVILRDELHAKIILAKRVNRGTGEDHYFQCGDHWHLGAPRKLDHEL